MAFIKFYPDEPWFRCRNCRGKFQRPRCGWKKGPKGWIKRRPKFCSPECFKEYVQERVPTYSCEYCGEKNREVAGRTRFCNDVCYRKKQRELGADNPGTFRKNNRPWNAGKKGIQLSPESAFKPGHQPINWYPVGTERLRTSTSKLNGSREVDDIRVYIKVAEPNKWKLRSRQVWEQANGPIPPGYVVRHKNLNRLDDRLENLEMITQAENLRRTLATGDNNKKKLYMASLAAHQRQEELRRERRQRGEPITRLYSVPLYQRMDIPACSAAGIITIKAGGRSGGARIPGCCGGWPGGWECRLRRGNNANWRLDTDIYRSSILASRSTPGRHIH